MARPKHRIRAAGAYFVTSITWQKRELFRKPEAATILVETLLHYREKGFYRLHDYVVMPDHLHLILTPNQDTSLEKGVQMIKGGSSHRMGKQLQMRFPVWQAGFHEHWIRSREDYEARRRYIETNPVKAKLAERAEEYPYSSAVRESSLDQFHWTPGAKAPVVLGSGAAGLKPRPTRARDKQQ